MSPPPAGAWIERNQGRNQGGTFIRYSHNSTVTTTSNITYTAYFERNVGISEADGDALFHNVYADGGRIVVAGAEGEREDQDRLPQVREFLYGEELNVRLSHG